MTFGFWFFKFINEMEKKNLPTSDDTSSKCAPCENAPGAYDTSQCSLDKEADLATCRVCQCAESDKRGDAAMAFLGITAPRLSSPRSSAERKSDEKIAVNDVEDESHTEDARVRSGLVEFISPSGEVFLCLGDIEAGSDHNQDTLIELGCACKNDLALVHYACALKWFVNRGAPVCEICFCVAKNVRPSDFKKIMNSLKEYELLRESTANGEPIPAYVPGSSGVDPDAIAAIRRQRLSEISLWFNPHNASSSAAFSLVVREQPSASNVVSDEVIPATSNATKWAVEATAILLATGLLTVTLAWLIGPHFGQKTANNGLRILLGGVCALTVVIFFRFFVLSRIRYGPARYWAILFVFWFLIFGIWASRTHNTHAK